jgi:hypothetical protein
MVVDVTIETFVTLTAQATVITLVAKLVVNVGRSSCESPVLLCPVLTKLEVSGQTVERLRNTKCR